MQKAKENLQVGSRLAAAHSPKVNSVIESTPAPAFNFSRRGKHNDTWMTNPPAHRLPPSPSSPSPPSPLDPPLPDPTLWTPFLFSSPSPSRPVFPDNYIPPSFLSSLSLVPPRPPPRLSTLLWAALPISEHVCVIALFVGVFWGLVDDRLGAAAVGWGTVGAGGIIAALRRVGWGWTRGKMRMPGQKEEVGDKPGVFGEFLPPPTLLRPLLLPPLLLSLLSPILGTLTSATTSDTIWPLAFVLFFVHLILADHTTGPDARRLRHAKALSEARKRQRRMSSIGGPAVDPWSAYSKPGATSSLRTRSAVQGSTTSTSRLENADRPAAAKEQDVYADPPNLTSSLSLTSALSASVVLASRLPSTAHVFSLVLLAVGLFAGWPTVAKGIRESGKPFSLALTLSMSVLAISFFPSSRRGEWPSWPTAPAVSFVSVLGLVNVLGPLGFWWAWRFKTRRGGGWDPAVVRIRREGGVG